MDGTSPSSHTDRHRPAETESFVPMCGLGSGTQRQLELSTSRSTASDSPNVTHSALIVSCGRSCLILGTPRTDFRGSSQLPGASNEDGTSTLQVFGEAAFLYARATSVPSIPWVPSRATVPGSASHCGRVWSEAKHHSMAGPAKVVSGEEILHLEAGRLGWPGRLGCHRGGGGPLRAPATLLYARGGPGSSA